MMSPLLTQDEDNLDLKTPLATCQTTEGAISQVEREIYP
jgi:hypothetical protein